MDKTQVVGIIAGTLTSIASIPQLVKIIQKKKVEDISLGMVLFLIMGISVWVYYGILRSDWPVIITNSFSLLVNITLLILYKIFKK